MSSFTLCFSLLSYSGLSSPFTGDCKDASCSQIMGRSDQGEVQSVQSQISVAENALTNLWMVPHCSGLCCAVLWKLSVCVTTSIPCERVRVCQCQWWYGSKASPLVFWKLYTSTLACSVCHGNESKLIQGVSCQLFLCFMSTIFPVLIGSLQQRNTHHSWSSGGCVWRNSVSAYEFFWWGPGLADRVQCTYSSQHPDYSAGGGPHHQG